VPLTLFHAGTTQDRRLTKNTDNTETKHNAKSKQCKTQQNKTTLVSPPFTTLGQETRWAYSTTLPSPPHYPNRISDQFCVTWNKPHSTIDYDRSHPQWVHWWVRVPILESRILWHQLHNYRIAGKCTSVRWSVRLHSNRM